MILDAFLQFTGGSPNSGTVTVGNGGDQPTTGTLTGSNIIDLGVGTAAAPALPPSQVGPPNQPVRDIGIGDDPAMKILLQVTTVFAGGTSLATSITGAPDNGSGAPGAFVAWWATPAYSLATLTVGARLMDMDMPRPPAGVPIPRFLQLSYTAAGTFTGGGTVKGFLVLDRMDQIYNASANNVMGGYAAGVTIAN